MRLGQAVEEEEKELELNTLGQCANHCHRRWVPGMVFEKGIYDQGDISKTWASHSHCGQY